MFNSLILKIKAKILRKDMMELKIADYRKKGVKIGNGVRTFSPIISAEPYLIEIGNNVTISSNVSFITHDNAVTKVYKEMTDVFGKIRIEDNCFIGLGAIILPGITIGEGSIVGAGSVVTKSFSEGNIVIGGNPAKKICTISEYENKIKNYAMCTRNLSYEEKKAYLQANSNKYLVK